MDDRWFRLGDHGRCTPCLMLPNLAEIVNQPTVLLLGAGASMDYGFPSWNQLKADLIRVFSDDQYPELSEDDGAKWWIDQLTTMSDSETVDNIENKAPGNCYDLFRIATALVICEYEANGDRNSSKLRP